MKIKLTAKLNVRNDRKRNVSHGWNAYLVKASLLLSFLFLSACASTYTYTKQPKPGRPDVPQLPEISDKPQTTQKPTAPLPSSVEEYQALEAEIIEQEIANKPKQSAVVTRLLASATKHSEEQNWTAAANSLERAIRIEPKNAYLWSELAEVNVQQQNWQQTVQFAAKSNVYAGKNISLKRKNWLLMRQSYEALGDNQRAEQIMYKLIKYR